MTTIIDKMRSGVGKLDELRRDSKYDDLKQENERLREQLADRTTSEASKCGYLHKFRGQAESSLFSAPWQMRYVLLKGSELRYFLSERVTHCPPRGTVSVRSAVLEVEGRRRGKYWAFHLRDKNGVSLMRLSTEVHMDFLSWCHALLRAGAVLAPGSELDEESDSDDERVDSSPPSAPAKRAHWGLRPSAPVHHGRRSSLLSGDRVEVSNQNGLVMLMFLIMVTSNARLVLENVIKYGFRFNPLRLASRLLAPSADNLPLVLCYPALALLCLAVFAVERWAAGRVGAESKARAGERKRAADGREGGQGQEGGGCDRTPSRAALRKVEARAALTERVAVSLQILLTAAVQLVPFSVIHYTESEPMPGFVLTFVAVVLWLKLVSYAHVNWDFRAARRAGEVRPGERGHEQQIPGVQEAVLYPENVTLASLGYFLAAPTLCYQTAYPRSGRFRTRWLARRLAALFVLLTVMAFFVEQYIGPSIDSSLQPMQDMDWLRMAERVLKLSLPTLYLWLAMFVALFDIWLNVVAEITGFGDREFYKEWWNASTVGDYWRLWNMPVHKWMLRHVYFPCVRYGLNKFVAGLIVFFVSAVFHEVLVGVPLHMVRSWSFWGIMAQVPLMLITEWLKKKLDSQRIGNAIFWISFCFLGQPLSIILYYHDYRKMHGLLH